jgi:uncharacterized membrane protein YbhN (UPF0104 family)
MRVLIATVVKLLAAASRSRRTRVAAQALVSLVLIALLIKTIPAVMLAAAWEHVGLQTLLLGCGCFALATLANVRRWQILLRSQDIEENAARLTEVFFIGLFCSLFLPTAAGGDAYRVFELSRRCRSTGRVLLATLQDRLLSLGPTAAFGFAGTCFYFDLLPGSLAVSALVVCGLGILAVIGLWHLRHIIHLATHVLARYRMPAFMAHWSKGKAAASVIACLRPLGEAPLLNMWRTVRVVGLAAATFLGAVAMYAAVGDALDVHCSFLAWCLIVSLVGVVRMLPISLGGYGASELAFVTFAGLFGIAEEKAAPVALVVMGVGAMMSLLGGLLLLRRTLFGMRLSSSSLGTPQLEAPAVLAQAVGEVEHGGTYRHAA